MLKVVFIIAIVLTFLFLMGNLWTYPLQQFFIFRPERLADDYKFKFNYAFEELSLPTSDGGLINALLFKSKNSVGKSAVLYFHGNADNCQRWGQVHRNYTDAGYDFFIMDYRGFGKSKGKQSQKNIYRDAQLCYDFLRDKYEANEIIIVGRSLGTAMATYVASKNQAKRLILESPFYSMKDLFYNYYPFLPRLFLFKFPFPTNRYLRKVQCPVTIFHGTDDYVVHYESAVKLKKYLKKEDEFVSIEGGSHSDLETYHIYREKMKEIFY